MGTCLSAQINMMAVQYLKDLASESAHNSYTIDNYEQEFHLNGSPGSPLCKINVKNTSITCPKDLHFDDSAAYRDVPIDVRAPKIKISIGEAVFSCNELDYLCRVTGLIKFSDVRLIASFTAAFEDDLRINDLDTEVTVKKIKSDIKLIINGGDHSAFANALLSTENPDLANTIVNSLFTLQKGTIQNLLNAQISTSNLL